MKQLLWAVAIVLGATIVIGCGGNRDPRIEGTYPTLPVQTPGLGGVGDSASVPTPKPSVE